MGEKKARLGHKMLTEVPTPASSRKRRPNSVEVDEINVVDDFMCSGLPYSRWSTAKRSAVLRRLKRLSFFASLSDARLEAVLPYLCHVRLAPNEPLYQQGDAPDLFYIVFTGAIQFVRAYVATDGQRSEQVMGSASPGELVGELGFVTRRPRATSAKAGPLHAHLLARWRGRIRACRAHAPLPTGHMGCLAASWPDAAETQSAPSRVSRRR